MTSKNFDRMVKLAEEFFETRNDPCQISVNEEVLEKLHAIHPASVTQQADEDGPVAWILVIPTLREIMEKFLSLTINEQQLLDQTPLGAAYDSIYLCSVLVLPEYRGKGLATRLTVKAIQSIQKQHSVSSLFV